MVASRPEWEPAAATLEPHPPGGPDGPGANHWPLVAPRLPPGFSRMFMEVKMLRQEVQMLQQQMNTYAPLADMVPNFASEWLGMLIWIPVLILIAIPCCLGPPAPSLKSFLSSVQVPKSFMDHLLRHTYLRKTAGY